MCLDIIKPNFYRYQYLIVAALFTLVLSAKLKAQENFSFQLDIGGAIPYGSLNIEKKILKRTSLELKIKGGVGLAGIDVIEPPRTYIKLKPTFPVGLNLLFGNDKRPSNFEIGIQGTFVTGMTIPEAWDTSFFYKENIENKVLSSFFVGYRFKPFKRKGLIRIGYCPILLDGKIISWGVLSLGWTFGKSKKG
jgi:hypothetical protein